MRGALTNCRAHREGQVRTLKETEHARGTHSLSSAQGGSSQDTERNRACEGHSLSIERTGTVKSGHQKKPSARGALTNYRAQREDQVRTLTETEYARGTHSLS